MILIVVLFSLLISLVVVSWELSAENGEQSNQVSQQIAEKVENCLGKHFPIDPSDTFWRVTFNLVLRKAAHFVEYFAIGTVMCAMLNVISRKVFPAASISVLLCLMMALTDEYHQMFTMRKPRLFDVYIDATGALAGVLIVSIFFGVFNYISHLKNRIKEYEEKEI
ncbi:VanZ family protein [Syntrophobotulus glycolicus]|nr:VanZ family protein [Syntrophobotulus glycolicus]